VLSSPIEYRTLSIQPKQSSWSTKSCQVTEGRPVRLRWYPTHSSAAVSWFASNQALNWAGVSKKTTSWGVGTTKHSSGEASFTGVSQSGNGPRHYNMLAGTNLERLAAISDGIFAVGMTLLVLGLAVPAANKAITEDQLLRELGDLLPSIVTYFMSFLTLGIFWVAQQTQLSMLTRTDRNYTWLQLLFLLAVTLVPFSTGLLAHFWSLRVALIEYWLNIVVMGAVILACLEYALRADLMPESTRKTGVPLMRRRIFTAQSLYAFGTLLCVVDTRVSIGFIVLVQLNYAIAPRIPILHRL
jgi:uncharacterized membrane protein